MPLISFDIDWMDAEGVNGPELAATWASLKIRAGDAVATRVFDTRAKTVRDFVHVPLYPLAEWLAANWWFLVGEFANPAKVAEHDFHRHHRLGPNREGYAFPNLEVIPAGTLTRFAWLKTAPQWTRVEFLDSGELWLDSDKFREDCADFIDLVIRRLVDYDIHETFLQQEWQAIQSADPEEAHFCAVAAGLGWDPYALNDAQSKQILVLYDKLGDLLDEAVPALDFKNLDAGCSAITDALDKAKDNAISLRSLRSHNISVMPPSGISRPPWQAGYDLARQLRLKLDTGNQPLPTDEILASVLSESAGALARSTQTYDCLSTAPHIDGVITTDDGRRPAFVFRPLHEAGKRYHFCRALAEVLVYPGANALLTSARTERQQLNRAFSAEFLAPAAALKERIRHTAVDSDAISDLAAEFGVSSNVILHQIENHQLAQVWQ